MATASMNTTQNTQKTAYERALERAHTVGLEVMGQGRTRHGDRFLLVPSTSEQGRSHVVTIQGAHLHCDCQAGVHDRMCMHRALAHEYLVKESERRQALGAQRAQMEHEEREEERRRSSDGHGGQETRHAPRLSDDSTPISMWK